MSPRFGHMVQIDTPKDPEHVLKINFWSYEKGSKLKEFMIDYVEDAFMMEGRKDIDFLGKTSDNGAAIDFQELMLGFVWGKVIGKRRTFCSSSWNGEDNSRQPLAQETTVGNILSFTAACITRNYRTRAT
ncbi:hypothetical protein BGZ79_006518 [Entomortierella chlamydospora]|nr:hypothetical protein BGZ79_006518 [Entomortierella chlamydospora]